MQNASLALMFDELADLLEIQGANPFRVRAYRNAARLIADHPEPLSEIAADPNRSLTELPGIGKDLADKIRQMCAEGTFPQLEEARAQVPAGVKNLLRIPGLGPKKAQVLFKELGITDLVQLKARAEAGDVAQLKGFGKKTEQSILEGLAQVSTASQRVLLADAKPLADELAADLARVPGVTQVEAAGSLRRRRESVGDLDLLAVAADSGPVMDALAGHRLVEKVLARGETKQRVRLKLGLELDLRVVPAESYGAALQYFTGSKEHNIVMRRRAQERGLKINEYGVYRGETAIAGGTEADVYGAVGLPWIAPELREDRGEFERAERGTLPKLVAVSDIRGDLHMHTTASDGTGTIREMIEGAKARGLKYIAITDHSQRVSMANGLTAERLRAHWREIAAIREEVTGIEVLLGVECDILEDARMDLADDVLAEADWVIGVLHYGLRQSADEITKRLLTAIRNPHVAVIGHPLARMIGKRPPVAVHFEEILKACADEGVMLEINAHPHRLDLDEIHAAAARDRGIPIVISTDAHGVAGLDMLPWGVYQARRAGLTAGDVANTRSWPSFRKLLHRGRG